jgi:polysaccharide lyase-like protein
MARIKFPDPRPAVGAPFGEKTAYPQWNDCDYEGQGNGNGVNDRMQWAQNPSGPSVAVAKMWVQSGDQADKFGGCRAECWQEPHSLNGARIGQRVFNAFSVFLPADFKTAPGWGLVWQIHTPVGSTTLSPLLALDTNGGSLAFRGVGSVPGGWNKGHWQCFAVDITMGSGIAGSFKGWCAVDSKPDTSKAPTLQRSGYTTHPGDGDGVQWQKLGPYRDPAGGTATYPTVAFYGGYGYSTNSMAEALADAQFDAILGGTPPPTTPTNSQLVSQIKAELVKVNGLLDQIKDV